MSIRNKLLAQLGRDERNQLLPWLQEVALPQGLELSRPDQIDEFCYFPESGIGSTVVVSPEGRQSEVGVFGRDGMTPPSAILGSDRNPFRVLMQVGGVGFRVNRIGLLSLTKDNTALENILLSWCHVFTAQIAATALSNSSHSVEVRLARWVLMCHDRSDTDQIPLTHEFLSIMLGVRRPSVTTSLHILEGKRLIHAKRGLITVRDRKGLETFAADAYGASEQEYQRLLSHPGPSDLKANG